MQKTLFDLPPTKPQALRELKDLRVQIKGHDEAYYNATPLITDAEYDKLRKRLLELEGLYPDLITPDSPSQLVGAVPVHGSKVRHRTPMLSLDNAFEPKDLEEFLEKARRFLGMSDVPIPLMAEPKIDGVSASLTYEKGHLTLAATRGDGVEGENITENVKTIRDIPLILQGSFIPDSIEIRGEVYMGVEDFMGLNQERIEAGETPFANPRNSAAGSLRQLDSTITAKRPLKFLAYSWGGFEDASITTQEGLLDQLKAWGFQVSDLVQICKTYGDAQSHYESMTHKRDKIAYDIDGVVFKVNSFELQSRLGFSARSPRWAIAYKFEAEQAETTLEDIIVQVGRQGALTPVAKLAPVTVGGVVVSRASLHNEDEINRKGVAIGDRVIVQRAGDVIPQIVRVSQKGMGKPFIFPALCPACHGPVVRKAGMVALRCTNGLACPAQAVLRLAHFASRDAFDIEGLGIKSVEQLYQKGVILNPVDIFTLEERDKISLTPLRNWEGWGSLAASNLFGAIQGRRTIGLDRFIYALGIPQVGTTTAKLLARHFGSYGNFIAVMTKNPEEELLSVDGIGPLMVQELVGFFENEYNRDLLGKLGDYLIVEDLQVIQTGSVLEGKTIVFTGSLKTMTRAEAKARAESLGAKVGSSVSPKTHYVVEGEDAGSKAKLARELNLTILTEQEWQEMAQ